jgi:hypothetical protein
MPENETLPKTGKSKDWLTYADKKAQEFKDYHGKRNVLGQPSNPAPLQDDYSKLLSQNELQARKMGMELLRKEKAGELQGYRKGGRVKETGSAKLHKGEAIARKPSRKKSRSKSRASSR